MQQRLAKREEVIKAIGYNEEDFVATFKEWKQIDAEIYKNTKKKNTRKKKRAKARKAFLTRVSEICGCEVSAKDVIIYIRYFYNQNNER